jgi:hypothetical protein
MSKVMTIDGFDNIAYVGLFVEAIKARDGLQGLYGFPVTAEFSEADCVAALMEMYRGLVGSV